VQIGHLIWNGLNPGSRRCRRPRRIAAPRDRVVAGASENIRLWQGAVCLVQRKIVIATQPEELDEAWSWGPWLSLP
jgi:hypothetical protein